MQNNTREIVRKTDCTVFPYYRNTARWLSGITSHLFLRKEHKNKRLCSVLHQKRGR